MRTLNYLSASNPRVKNMIHMKNTFRKLRFVALFATLITAVGMSMTTWAVTLAEAKTAGMVGEMPDGYLISYQLLIHFF